MIFDMFQLSNCMNFTQYDKSTANHARFTMGFVCISSNLQKYNICVMHHSSFWESAVKNRSLHFWSNGKGSKLSLEMDLPPHQIKFCNEITILVTCQLLDDANKDSLVHDIFIRKMNIKEIQQCIHLVIKIDQKQVKLIRAKQNCLMGLRDKNIRVGRSAFYF